MYLFNISRLTLIVLCAFTFLLPACAPRNMSSPNAVAEAYNSSGVIAVKPYTRTIFSSNDF